MFELMMILQLMQVQPVMTAQVQPCVWPRKCEAPAVAQIHTCQWPNKCAENPIVAQVQPCVWPKKCEAPSLFPNG